MPTIDATVGGADANSYVTLSEATDYFDERLNTADWDGAEQDDQERALIMATRRLDQESYEGVRDDVDHEDQALEWPRSGATHPDGHAYDHDVIPPLIKRATYELALAMLGDDLLDDTGLEGFEEVSVGPLSVVPRHSQRAGELPEHVRREIDPVTIGSRNNVRLQRG